MTVKRTKTLLWIALTAVMLLMVACASDTPKVDWDLKISGAVSDPLTLSFADLAKRDQILLDDVVMRKSQGEDTTNDWEGPALDAILTEAGATDGFATIVCTASDGYAKEIPAADLADAIIALKQDGEWIATGDPDTPIRIVIPSLPANSWLFGLVELSVVE